MLLSALLAGLLACSHEGAPQWEESFFFVQMADPQFGMFADNADFKKETELFTKAIEHANRLKPAFVVICGDLINQPGDQAQAAEFLRIADTLDRQIPLHLVSGNHDVHNVPTPTSLRRYRECFGQDWYGFDHGGCRFIVLNSTIIHRPDNVEDEMQQQRAWLEDELEASQESGAVHTIVFQHHPYFLREPDEPDAYMNIPRSRRRTYLDLLTGAGVTAVLAGHYHRNAHGEYGDMEMVTTGPVGKPLGKDPSGLRIVEVHRDRIEHAYYGLDAVPPRVEPDASRAVAAVRAR